MTRMRLGVTVSLALLLAGCGAQTAEPSAAQSPAPESTSLSVAPTQAEDTDPDQDPANGQMVVVYDEADTPEAISGRALMQDTNLLADLADDVNSSFQLPYDIPLNGSQCDEANDFWSPSDQAMTLCYEDVAESLRIFADDPDPQASARRIGVASFYHELGHMLIDIYDLPATGREEDVADQLSAFILLTPGEDGVVDPDDVQAAKDAAREYRIWSQEGGAPDDSAFSDVHSLNQARMYNMECWIYGSDPDGNADIVADGLLPQDRADGCQEEFDKLSNAWGTLLEPHLK